MLGGGDGRCIPLESVQEEYRGGYPRIWGGRTRGKPKKRGLGHFIHEGHGVKGGY